MSSSQSNYANSYRFRREAGVALCGLFLFVSTLDGSAAWALAKNTLLGKPVAIGAAHRDETELEKNQYTVGFSAERLEPYWVSWYVDSSSFGEAKRKNRFHKEPESSSVQSALPADYKKSGYDRGHMCPSADRTKTAKDNYETFSMANMVPQVKELNRGPWKELEDYCRELVKNDNSLLIMAGEYGNKASVNEKVVVPSHCWKVIVVLPDANSSAKDITEDTRVIAVVMPNDPVKIKGTDWTEHITTVGVIEKEIKYDLLSDVSKKVQREIEDREDEGDDDIY